MEIVDFNIILIFPPPMQQAFVGYALNPSVSLKVAQWQPWLLTPKETFIILIILIIESCAITIHLLMIPTPTSYGASLILLMGNVIKADHMANLITRACV